VGSLGEQVKTRMEVAAEKEGTRDVQGQVNAALAFFAGPALSENTQGLIADPSTRC
jgi:hypothetical protein